MNIGAAQGYSYSSPLSFGQNQYTGGKVLQEDHEIKEEERDSIHAADLKLNRQRDSFLESLREQYRGYQEELNSLSAKEELTPEEKLARRKELQEQISGIKDQIITRQQQLQQLEKENTQEELEKRQRESASNNSDMTETKYQNKLHQSFLTEASMVMSEVGTLHRLKMKTEGEVGVASIELKLSMARSGGVSESLSNNVSEANQRLSQIDLKFSEKLGKLNKLVKEQKDELKSQDKDLKNKISSETRSGGLETAKVHTEDKSYENAGKEEKEKTAENRYHKHVDVLV